MKIQDIEEILPGIYKIPVPLEGNPLRELNSYLILGEKNLLVDTGFHAPYCKKAVEEGLALLGVSMENTDILLTHFHADHSGNAPDLIREGNHVYLSEEDYKYLKYASGLNGNTELHEEQKGILIRHGIDPKMADEMLANAPSKNLAGDLSFDGYTLLHEGDRIQAGPYTLNAISTPGHTPGQMCFDIEGTGAMILGDQVLFDITPNITNWPLIDNPLGTYLESLDKIDAYDVTIPLPGHRKPGDFHERIAQLKRHHEKRLKECRVAIQRLDRARLYDIAGSMKWKIRGGDWDHFPAGQRWFALGECLAHLEYLMSTDEVMRHEDEEGYWFELQKL